MIRRMTRLEDLVFDNTYAGLPEGFYDRPDLGSFPEPYLVSANPAVAELIGLDPAELQRPEFLAVFSGRERLEGMQPLAMGYAGHQFGVYVPQLGDGRATLLGEVRNGAAHTWDLQLKGAGPTRYSRGGDGRAVLRSTIREYLASEAMHALGIPTTRALAILGSDLPVYREGVETAAMLIRVAPSHVRFGSFEYFYHQGRHDRVSELADYVLAHHFPELLGREDRYLELLRVVTRRTARLIAQWQAVGFAHGVMNSDNMSILGLTLDYGPYGFMEAYDPGLVCNHSDHRGRYAFDRQPQIGLWNLGCLAHGMLCLLGRDEEAAAEQARSVLEEYGPEFGRQYAGLMQAKLGLRERSAGDAALIDRLLGLMRADRVDYTILFRRLGDFRPGERSTPLRDLFLQREAFDAWAADYAGRLAQEGGEDTERRERMNRSNPKYVLRNYMAEIAIAKAVADRDYSEVDRLLRLVQAPFDEHEDMREYAGLPPDWSGRIVVSCSS
jgi:hypothetical protein